MDILKTTYEITVDWTGTKFLGLTLKWNYIDRYVDLSMPGYIQEIVLRHQHKPPTKPEQCPHDYKTPTYGATVQYADDEVPSPPLTKGGITKVQQVVGSLLFYARALDPLLLTALNSIATEQARATIDTAKKITKILNYCATNPDNVLRFYASDMQLYVHSDESYLTTTSARSRAGGHYFLGNKLKDPTKPPDETLQKKRPDIKYF